MKKSKYNTCADWRKHNSAAYAAAKKPNSVYPIEQICKDFGMEPPIKIQSWEESYDLLIVYVKKHNELPKGKSKIACWCIKQRQDYKKNKLSIEKIKKLELISGWYWDENDVWDNNYVLLKEYVKKHNELPKKRSKIQNKKIGIWCSTQKEEYKINKLSIEKIKKLELISGWYWDVRNSHWDLMYNLTKEFISEYKHIPTSKEKYKNFNLGYWADNQIQNYKNKTLSQNKINKLIIINILINKLKNRWDKNYDLLMEYVKINNECPQQKTIYKKIKLGMWCSYQKTYYKRNKLNSDRIRKLELIKSWNWNDFKNSWDENYVLLKQYVNKFNKIPKCREIFNNNKIGYWIGNQKQNYKKNILDKKQIHLLESIKGWHW